MPEHKLFSGLHTISILVKRPVNGQHLSEFGLILGLVVLIGAITLVQLGNGLTENYQSLTTQLTQSTAVDKAETSGANGGFTDIIPPALPSHESADTQKINGAGTGQHTQEKSSTHTSSNQAER
jgi:Flp pilus assembly pilin Flp